MGSDLFLTIIDIDRIQDYIFLTHKLKTIVGGSLIMAKITSEEYCKKNTCLKNLTEAKAISELRNSPNRYLPIFFGGGNAKIIFNDMSGAVQFVKDMHRLFNKEAPSATFSHVIFKHTGGFDHTVIRKAEKVLQAVKLSKPACITVNHNPLYLLCESCGLQPAYGYNHSVRKHVCHDCRLRIEAYESYMNYPSDVMLKEFSEGCKGDDCLKGTEFEEEFDLIKDDRSYLATIIMDGDDVGKKIMQITKGKREDDCVKELKDFSKELSAGVLRALLEATRNTFAKYVENGSDRIPFRPLIIGGDDICVVMAGKEAFKFVKKFSDVISNEGFFRDNNIAYSIGVCISKSHFPFYFSHKIAEDLVKNAKACKRREGLRGCLLDWEILYGTSFSDLSTIRESIYLQATGMGEQKILTMKPYSLMNGNGKSFGDLEKAAKVLEHSLGSSKFRNLRRMVRKNIRVANYEFREMLSKVEGRREIKESLEKFGLGPENIWSREGVYLRNNFNDMVEIASFQED